MIQNSKFTIPALLALSMFAFMPAQSKAGNEGEPEVDKGMPDTSKNGGGGGHGQGGGGSYSENSGLITCVVNGHMFKVRDIRKCYVQPAYQPRPPTYHAKKKHRRVAVSGGVCGCSYGGGYEYSQQPVIRYYKPSSRAAIMQAQKRAAAYGYVEGYSTGGEYTVSRKKHRRMHYNAPIYMPSYDQGYVVHYGPTISKDGGY